MAYKRYGIDFGNGKGKQNGEKKEPPAWTKKDMGSYMDWVRYQKLKAGLELEGENPRPGATPGEESFLSPRKAAGKTTGDGAAGELDARLEQMEQWYGPNILSNPDVPQEVKEAYRALRRGYKDAEADKFYRKGGRNKR